MHRGSPFPSDVWPEQVLVLRTCNLHHNHQSTEVIVQPHGTHNCRKVSCPSALTQASLWSISARCILSWRELLP